MAFENTNNTVSQVAKKKKKKGQYFHSKCSFNKYISKSPEFHTHVKDHQSIS